MSVRLVTVMRATFSPAVFFHLIKSCTRLDATFPMDIVAAVASTTRKKKNGKAKNRKPKTKVSSFLSETQLSISALSRDLGTLSLSIKLSFLLQTQYSFRNKLLIKLADQWVAKPRHGGFCKVPVLFISNVRPRIRPKLSIVDIG